LDGTERGAAYSKYAHGQITSTLPSTGAPLPPDYALQHPSDWLLAATRAVRGALRRVGKSGSRLIGIGVDFTSCTMLPALKDGTPLCLLPEYEANPLAWPKLWKHHGAKSQTEHIERVANERRELFLDQYSGSIGLEWFFPKLLETLEVAPEVYRASEVWVEAGDWVVWQLVGCGAREMARSTCQAGYKGMWTSSDGYPSKPFLRAVHPDLVDVVRTKMLGRMKTPGQLAGRLCKDMAKKFRVKEGTPVSTAIIDAHAGVPGVGAADPGTLVMVCGTSCCHMLNATEYRRVPGVAGIVKDGILPGMFGYETGQAAVGDAFDWLRKLARQRSFTQLTNLAASVGPGADGVLCVDWMNGCRTPLMDGRLGGAFTGLTLRHGSHHLYRALLEATAYGLRWIVDILRENGVPVKKFIATGGLPHRNPLFMQVTADVLGENIIIHPSQQGPALGAAILGAVAAGKRAGGFSSVRSAVRTIGGVRKDVKGRTGTLVSPDRRKKKTYEPLYRRYRETASFLQGSNSAS
jgi:L-ribulokinase